MLWKEKIYKFKTNFVNVIFGSHNVFHIFLKVPFIFLRYVISGGKIAPFAKFDTQKKTLIERLSNSL